MRRKIVLVFILLLSVEMSNSWAWGKKDKSSAPQTVSQATKKAEKKAQDAKTAAESAKQHADTAMENLQAAKVEAEISKAKSDAAKAQKAAKEAEKNAQKAKDAAEKNGVTSEDATKAAEEARIAADEAAKAAQEAEDAYNRLVAAGYDLEEALRLAEEQQAISDEAEALLQEAIEADEDYNDAWSEYLETKTELEQSIDALEVDRDTISEEEYNALINDFLEKEKKSNEAYKNAEEKAEATIAAYNKLGEFVNTYNLSGDPVFVGTGDYVAEYEDFIAQDYLEKFTVQRNLTSDGFTESFGSNWTCSLDSRIVRCVYDSYDSKKALIEKCLELSSKMKKVFEDYNTKHPKYPRTETSSYISYAELVHGNMTKELEDVSKIISERNDLMEKNKYSCYGRFSKSESYTGYSNQLIFVDDMGLQNYFEYAKDGLWETAGSIRKNSIRIYNLNSNGNKSGTEDCTGGYEVVYSDGKISLYSKYGILEKITDTNGNVTLYKSKNGLINQIILKTGEAITVERNNQGFITKIWGAASGETVYKYGGNELIEVTDNSGIKIAFSYDDGRLSKITKADNCSIEIKYDFNSSKGNYVCSQIKNENGDLEEFDYDFNNRLVYHKISAGKTERYELNENGNPVYIRDNFGNETVIETNEKSLVQSIKKNGIKNSYVYDQLLRPVKIISDNGATTLLTYCSQNTGNKVEKITDADGFSSSFEYDNKGNVTAEYLNGVLQNSCEYFPSGLLKKIENSENTIEYEYNEFGSVTKRVTTDNSGNKLTAAMEYDSKNRLIKIVDEKNKITTFSYRQNSVIEESKDYKKETFKDLRNRITKEVCTDFRAKTTCSKEYKYNGSGDILEIYLNGELLEQNNYGANGNILSKINWNYIGNNAVIAKQGIKEEYQYDDSGYLKYYRRSVVNYEKDLYSGKINSIEDKDSVETYAYEKKADKTVVKHTNAMELTITKTYDSLGRLVLEEYPGGYYIKTTYSKGGRILYKTDSSFNKWEYQYSTDGNYTEVFSSKSGTLSISTYNRNGDLLFYKDDLAGSIYYVYENRKLREKKTSSSVLTVEYDKYGRKTHYKLTGNNTKTAFSNYSHKENSEEYFITYDDDKNTMRFSTEKSGDYYSLVFLDYNNYPVKVIDKNGVNSYEYDFLGRITKRIDGKNNETEFLYDSNNKVNYVLYPDKKERFIIHNVNGDVVRIEENNHVYAAVNYDIQNRTVTFKDEFGKESKISYDSDGNIFEESISNSGKKKSGYIGYEQNQLLNKMYAEFTPAENLAFIENEVSVNLYEYNSMGKVIQATDFVTDINVTYEYDAFGRCRSKSINNKKIDYEYDDCGLIGKVSDFENSFAVSFDYDCYGRETKRIYGNGIEVYTRYNEYGLIESKVIRDQFGQLLYGDFLLYNDDGKLSYRFDKDGACTSYSYNQKGQLECVESPYSDEICRYYQTEVEDCGGPLLINPKDTNLYLDFSTIDKINLVLAASRVENLVRIIGYEKTWKQEYSYTNNGAVNSVSNNLGIINYSYNSLNQLELKYFEDFYEDGIKLSWNNNGTLKEISGKISLLDFFYGANNKLASVTYSNKKQSDERRKEFLYDGLGRLVREKENGNSVAITYDGFSNEVLSRFCLSENNFLPSEYISEGEDENQIYRYTNDSSYSPFGGQKYKDIISTPSNNVTSGKNEINIIVYEEIIGNFEDGNSVISLRDYQKQLVSDADTSREYNLFDELKAIGQRYLLPSMNIFTTEDPAHDGINWYSYCSGDFVNYTDMDGNVITPVPRTYLMTDPVYKDKKTGNSTDSADSINKVGCYLACYANALAALYGKGVVDADKVRYTSILGINEDKTLFSTDPETAANLIRKTSMDKIFNSSNDYAKVTWDYFTKEVSGELKLKIEMAKAAALQGEYVVMGVFDLSDTYSKITNHMVIINSNYDEFGVFADITESSINDRNRLTKTPQVYCVDNLKEIRLVKVEKKCSK